VIMECQFCNGELKERNDRINGQKIFSCVDCGKKFTIENGMLKRFKI